MLPTNDVYTDFQGFTALRREASQQSPEAIKQVAKQFESIFVGMMLKSMRDTLPEGGLFNSETERMYRDMFDKQLALNISNGKGIGLAAVIERQLSQQTGVIPVSTMDVEQAVGAPTGAQITPCTGCAPEGAPAEIKSTPWASADEFVDSVWPYAVRAGNELGVWPEVLVAQSALETGWGQHMRRQENGSPSYALFGIKADSRWEGDRVSVSTLEFRDGAMQRERAQFRAYGSVAEAFDDYVDFIQRNPRYQQALAKGYDPQAWASELQQAGYATDPDYADKIERVRQSSAVQMKLSEFKLANNQPIT
ncbi:MAG: flagellar assembly peptidoglycan hydrolase FlgJ [Gammaproteobacteria bacterium]|nr:flagellar assembly peptidoglycan hydrolase FlgJ [Gammaproteobacteria bacterium]